MESIKRKTKRIISIILIITILVGVLPNFGLLKITKAVSNEAKMIVKPGIEELETVGEEKIFKLNVYINNVDLYGFVIYLAYPEDKIIPCDKFGNTIETTTSAASVAKTIECNGSCEIITMSDASSIINTETGAFGAAFEYNAEETIITEETLMCTILFKVKKDDSNNFAISNISELSSDDFSLTNSVGVYESMITDYEEDDIMASENPSWFSVEGFKGLSVQSISVKTNPTEGNKYTHGDTIDLEGGELTATYTDGSTKDISMLDKEVTIKTGEEIGAIADINNTTLTFEYEKASTELEVNVIDPIESIEFYDKFDLMKDYEFSGEDELADIMDFDNIFVKAIKKSGAEAEIALSNERITLDSTKADTNKIKLETAFIDASGKTSGIQEIGITYKDEDSENSTLFNIIVNDTIGEIKISTTNPPEELLTVGNIFTKSGAIEIIGKKSKTSYGEIEMSSGDVTVTEINGSKVDLSKSANEKTLEVTYAGVNTTYTVKVEDAIEKIRVNGSVVTKYNEPLKELDFDGITITEIMASGDEGATVHLDFTWIDTSTYDNTTIKKQELKVNYPYNGKNIEGTVTAQVEEELLGIRIENLKDEYVYKDELNYESAELYIQYVSEEYGPISLTDFDFEDTESDLKVSGFDNTKIGSQELTFTYNDEIDEVSTKVSVNVGKATLKAPECEELEIIEGKALSTIENQLPTTEYGSVIWKDATQALTYVEGENNIQEVSAIYKINVTYAPYYNDVDLKVKVKVLKREVASIEITTPANKVDYIEGQDFDPTGMKITVTYNDGDTATINSDYESKGITFAPSTNLQTTNTEVVVTYRGKTDIQTITVIPDYVSDITITAPSKLEYNYGDTIDLVNATITKVWASGLTHTNDTIPMTKDMLSNDDITSFDNMEVLGQKQVTVTYDSFVKANAFQITIKDYVKSIEIEDKTKLQTEYEYGDTINVKDKDTNGDLYIITKYAVNTPDGRITLTADMLSGFNMTILGKQTVTVTYEGKTDTYPINVKDVIKGIDITKEPTKKVYKLNEAVSFDDIVVKNAMASGEIGKTLEVSEYTIGAVDTTTTGEKTVTVTKVGTTFTDTFKIKVIDSTEDIFITKLPTKVNYKYGEALDVTGGEITVTLQTGTKIVLMTDKSVKITGYNPNKLGEQTITVTYTYEEETENGIETKQKTDTYTVNVEDYETEKIQITMPTKRIYEYGEALDLEGGTVSKVMASGALKDTKAITGEMVTGYNATTLGSQTLTITYLGKTVTFDVEVVDSTLGISMKTLPEKTEYTQGEILDVSGAVLNVTKSSGIKEIAVTKEMISGYDPEKTGTQLITVTYDGYTTEIVISVKARTIDKPVEPEKPTKPNKPVKPNKPTNPVKPATPSTSEVIKYTVTFIDYDGTILKTEEVESGKSATAPELEERIGYKFLGWDTDFDVVEQDLNVTVQYEKIEATTKPSEKPSEVLGVKDESNSTENNITGTLVPALTGVTISGLLLLLIAAITKKNVEIYAVLDGERKLLGKERLTKKYALIFIDKYKEELEKGSIEVVLNSKISKKLNGENVDIILNEKKLTYRVKVNENEAFVIEIKSK